MATAEAMRPRITGIHHTGRRAVLGPTLLYLMALLTTSREMSGLDAVLARGELRLVTRPGPIAYYEDARGPNGFEYLLAKKFADSLGVELKVTTADTLANVYHMLGGPNADFAAATLSVTPYRRDHARFSDAYGTTVQKVLYRRGTQPPASIEELVDRQVVVVADSSHEERLADLLADYPQLRWQREPGADMADLMEMVHSGEAEFAIIDDTTYGAHQNFYHNARAAFEISEPQPLAWAFPRHGDDSLARAANAFFTTLRESGYLDELKIRFFTGIEDFSVSSSQVFFKLVASRLPVFEELFKTVAQETAIDWHLLAAIAYQESHWNPAAVSPTGVKGLMMLTRNTAREVKVVDRTDPEQSLRGGAQYFLHLKKRIDERVSEPDRTWFALAAYNIGLGHLEDARLLTQRLGKNPNHWQDVQEHLPLLQKRQYYRTVRYGYARGNEAVIFVRNIRKYLRILQWRSTEENRRESRDQPALEMAPQKWDLRSFQTL